MDPKPGVSGEADETDDRVSRIEYRPDAPEIQIEYRPDAPGMHVQYHPDAPEMQIEYRPEAPEIQIEYRPEAPGIQIEYRPDAPEMHVQYNPGAPGRHIEPANPASLHSMCLVRTLSARETGNDNDLFTALGLMQCGSLYGRVNSPPSSPFRELSPLFFSREGSPEEVNVGQLESSDKEGSRPFSLEVESAEEAAICKIEPADVADSPEDAVLSQLEPADVKDSPESADEVNIGQLELSDEGSRPSSMEVDNGEPDPRANEDGAVAIAGDREEPRRMNFEDIRRRVQAGPPNPPPEDDVPRVLRALLGEGGDLRQRAEVLEQWVAAGQIAIANMRRGVDALEEAAENFRRAMHAMEAGFGGRGPADGENPAADPA